MSHKETTGTELAHALERRRSIIDSAIVKFLKREKKMSIDNVVLNVSDLEKRKRKESVGEQVEFRKMFIN